MRALAAVMLVVTVAAAGDEWPHPRGNLGNTGVVKNKGPKKAPKVKWKRVTCFVDKQELWSFVGTDRTLDGFVGLWVQERSIEVRRFELKQ